MQAIEARGTLKDSWLAARMNLVVGDCLDIYNNGQFTGLLHNKNPNNTFDVLMCANVIHFFDGEQALKFFINTFNLLKPGGKAHILTQSRFQQISLLELANSGYHPSYLMMNVCATIFGHASKNPDLIFPCYLDDKWLLKSKSPGLKALLQMKPNGLSINHFIPERTLNLLGKHVGFDIVSTSFCCPLQQGPVVKMVEIPTGYYCGIVLEKPADHNGEILTVESLDQKFVQGCQGAKKAMQTLVEEEIQFIDGFPFVKVKPAIKKNRGFKKK